MTDETEIPVRTDYIGPYGNMRFIPHKPTRPEHQAHVVAYLIDAPGWHPVWNQYQLAVVSLKEFDGVPDPILKFPGATHELLVVAINPEYQQTVSSMIQHGTDGKLPYLTPVNIAEQFEATDEEMEKLAWLCGRAVVSGQLNPETGDGPERVRMEWLSACVKTLAHIRQEPHSAL